MANVEPLDEPESIPTVPESVEYGGKSNQSVKRKIEQKTRRGYGRKNRNRQRKVNQSIANGIQAKKESLFGNINVFRPSVITLQETKLRKTGLLRLPGYQVFEKIRSGFGGGLLTAVDENLLPVLISTGKCETSEILVVQLKTENHNIRIINAYGPQEDN